jgi:Shikimate dehydrogenase substrate binding domain
MSHERSYLGLITGSFSSPAVGNPTVVVVEAAYRRLGLDARYVNCEVPPERLGDAVRGALAMGWAGFNLSIPHKVAGTSCGARSLSSSRTRPRNHRILETAFRPMIEPSWG